MPKTILIAAALLIGCGSPKPQVVVIDTVTTDTAPAVIDTVTTDTVPAVKDTVASFPEPIPDTITVPSPDTFIPSAESVSTGKTGLAFGPSAVSIAVMNKTPFRTTVLFGDSRAEQTKARVDSLRALKGYYFLGMTTKRPFFIDSSKRALSVAKWKAWFDKTWVPVTAQVQYGFSTGTILGLYLMDEPRWANTWSVPSGWKGWTPAQVDSIACYVEWKWPFAKGYVAIRQEPNWWKTRPKCIGITWGGGIIGQPVTTATLRAYSEGIARDAAKIGTSYVLGFNRLNGGYAGASGTGTNPTNLKWKQATPAEYRTGDSTLITFRASNGTRPCAVIGWQYSPLILYPSGDPVLLRKVQAFDTLAAIKAISVKNAALAATQPARSCRRP